LRSINIFIYKAAFEQFIAVRYHKVFLRSHVMLKLKLLLCLALLPTLGWAQSALTETETRWLRAGAGVIAYAKQSGLPVDIVVQPEARPEDVPLAMGFQQERCKLVLTLRGNPGAEAIFSSVPAEQQALMIEAMMAHELGHCWRYAQGDWHKLPGGFVESELKIADDPALEETARSLRDTRREEGFSDLVALAWMQGRHPDQYQAVYTWMRQVRGDHADGFGSHDTLDWLALAADGTAFATAGNPFQNADSLWRSGLAHNK
jgi:hypothetical protein